MNIALIEPFYGGSHKQWVDGLMSNSQHRYSLLSLDAKNWKWRMYGGAISLAKEFEQLHEEIDLILASDMLDLALFMALCKNRASHCKTALYFHENQMTYPWTSLDKEKKTNRDRHYAFINYTSALCADKIFFNSAFHKTSFLQAAKDFLQVLPKPQELDSIDTIAAKSEVLYIGLDLPEIVRDHNESPPLKIAWNHRWEEDKNPGAFRDLLESLSDENFSFELILLGDRNECNPFLKEIEMDFASHIIYNAYASTKEDYYKQLSRADILPVTSHHDFFGISIVEAIQVGVHPLLPFDLSYPELIPEAMYRAVFYKDATDLKKRILEFTREKARQNAMKKHIEKFKWSNLIRKYDQTLLKIIR